MSQPDNLARCIGNRDVAGIVELMFQRNPFGIREGFFREDELWDYKQDIPASRKGNESQWADIAADVLAFHNQRGGVLVFGIRDRDFQFVGATHHCDTKLFNDKIRRYVGDRFWVSFSREFIQYNQRYVGVAVVPPRTHTVLRVMGNGPRDSLKSGDLCIRIGDETKIFSGSEALAYTAENHVPEAASLYAINEPNFRVLRPDYRQFTYRGEQCEQIEASLISNRTFITSLTGIGGVGKTALGSWGALLGYEKKYFDFIVSVTAKDRALTSTGIVPLSPSLSTLADLLREVGEVTGFSELSEIGPVEEQAQYVKKNILSEFRGLLFVDNLETVDDPLLISFLEDLPLPTRAIVTSRKTRVRVAALPLAVGGMTEDECVQFFDHVAQIRRKEYLADLSLAQKLKVLNSCDRIPLVIEWFVGRARSIERTLREAETLATEGGHGEELLEFSFRRIYGELEDKQQRVLKLLSLIGTQLPVEAIAAGSDLPVHEVADQLEDLRDYSLIETQYDLNYRDVVYSLLPVTNTFVYREVSKSEGYEAATRRRLNDWYQAKEVVDPAQRSLVQKVRRGERNPELALAAVAKQSLEAGDISGAEQFYKAALDRNHTNWQIHRDLAELYRHYKKETAMAIQHYRDAAENAPKQGPDRGSVFREYGLVLRDSGLPDAHRRAAEKLEIALKDMHEDAVCRHALGDCYVKMGNYQRAVEVLEPLLSHASAKTRQITIPLLSEAYRAVGEHLKLAGLRQAHSR